MQVEASATLLIDAIAFVRVESISVQGALPWVDVNVGAVTVGFSGKRLVNVKGVKLAFRESDPHLLGQREV